jgi:hypothetical protein
MEDLPYKMYPNCIQDWVVEIRMRSSLGLGIADGIITFLVGGFESIFRTFTVAFAKHALEL